MDTLLLKSKGRIYRIPREPFESQANTATRGWYIIDQATQKKLEKPEPSKKTKHPDLTAQVDAWVQASLLYLYQQKGMVFIGA